jgi:hypothetical protein
MIQLAKRHALGYGYGVSDYIDAPLGQTFGHGPGLIFAAGVAFPGAIVAPDHEHFFPGPDKLDNLFDRFLYRCVQVASSSWFEIV